MRKAISDAEEHQGSEGTRRAEPAQRGTGRTETRLIVVKKTRSLKT